MIQTPTSGLKTSLPSSTKRSNENQAGFNAAMFQGELVPLRHPTPDARVERPLPNSARLPNSRVPSVPGQQPESGFGETGKWSKQVSHPISRRQDSKTNRSEIDVESIPSLPRDADENENIIIQRFPDGKPRVIRYVAQDEHGNYFNHGPWEARNQAGQILAKGRYIRGLMDGQWSRKHESSSSGLFKTKPFNLFQGPFNSVAYFKNGKLDGMWTIYDQYQTKIFEIPYNQGVRDGIATWFYPNQGKMRQAEFKQGLIDGDIVDFDEEEKVTNRQQYVDGRPIVRNTTFYRPNVKKTEEYFLGKKLEPEDADDWWEAKPTPYQATGSPTQNGAAMAWYENGQPQKRGQFKDGKPVGQFTWWHANGNKQNEGFYIDGKKSRRWTWWYENGMKQVEGVFEDDQPIAVWRAWNPEGDLRKEKNYSDDSAIANENTANPTSSSQKSPTTENTDAVAPVQTDQKPTDQSLEPGLNGPITETLPSPTNARPDAGEPAELETIDPLEFRPPTTPVEFPPKNRPDSDEEEIGSMPSELFENQSEEPTSDGKTAEPTTADKSA